LPSGETEKNVLKGLVDLGLTTLQARLYIALTKVRSAKADKLSKISNVSRPDVYRVTPRLLELGLIERGIAKPVVFRAVPPEVAVEVLLKHKRNKLRQLESKAAMLVNALKINRNIEGAQEESQFIIVPKGLIIQRLKAAIDVAESNVDLMLHSGGFRRFCQCLAESLELAWSRNVRARAITGDLNGRELLEVWKRPWAEIRIRLDQMGASKVAGVIFDSREALIFTEETEDLMDAPALWTNSSAILAMAQTYFETEWKKAQPPTNIQVPTI